MLSKEEKKEEKKIYDRNYRLNHKNEIREWTKNQDKDKKRERQKRYRLKHKVKIKEDNKIYYNENKDKIKEYRRTYNDKNKEKLKERQNKYESKKRKNDSLYKLTCNLRNLINKSFKNKGYKKSSHTEEILGCSFEHYKTYIEFLMEPWMTWENYGKYDGRYKTGWDIDHCIPVSSAKTEDELLKLNNYANLQPMDSAINRVDKRNKL